MPPTGTGPRVVTGHIDFLQIRNGAIHILDYKPDARTNKPFAQLTIYALALSYLTGIPLFDFKCAWFNERQYCEFFRAPCSRARTLGKCDCAHFSRLFPGVCLPIPRQAA